MNVKPLPITAYLHECFTYDPLTGDLFWKERPRHHFNTKRGFSVFNAQMAGTVAGHKHSSKGRHHSIVVNMNHEMFYAHRIILALAGVHVPDGLEIDHLDVDPWNNKWSNLRLATHPQNTQNQKRHEDRKYDLPKGVYLRSDGKAFVSHITDNGTPIHIGSFPTVALAREAYLSKAIELRGEFACIV